MVGTVCKYIDAKRTLNTAEDYAMVTEALIAKYPALTLEEYRLIFDRMKTGHYGDYYERLKAPEFMKAFHQHEVERVEIIESLHREPITRGAEDPTRIKPYDAEQARLEYLMKRNPFYIKGKNDPKEEDPTTEGEGAA